MRLKIKQLGPVMAVAAALIAVPAAGAHADTTSSLPQLTGFHQMVVDDLVSPGYVFLSEGPDSESLHNGATSTGPLIVTDLAGNYLATVDNGGGVEGLALSPDGKTLYAALAAKNEVDAIDVSTITQPTPAYTPYQLGSGDMPIDLALQSGKLWVSYNTSPSSGAVGDIDLSAASPAFAADTLPSPSSSWYSAPQLAGDPSDGGVLIAAQPALSITEAASYNVTGSSPTMTAQTTELGGIDGCAYLDDLAVVPGGAQFIPACNTAQQTDSVYSAQDLSLQGSYGTNTAPAAVAIAANGTLALGAEDASGASIYLYTAGGSSPLKTISFSSSQKVAGRGLAWSAGVSKLYAVVRDISNSSLSLNVYNDPTQVSSTLSLSAPSSATIGKSYTISGKLALATGAPPAGTAVEITRTKPGTTTMHWTRQTATDGTFSLGNKPPAAGTYTYTATYAGTSTTKGATATAKVTVTKLPVSLWIKTSANKIRYHGTVKVTAHLGKTHNNRTVAIYARTVGSSKRVLLKRGHVNSSGYLTVKYYRAPHSKVFSAVFGGDSHYRARTVSRTVGVHVKVAVNYTGYYTTKRSGGKTFHIFHHTALLKTAIHVTPNKHGQCVKLQTQVYTGSWHNNFTTSCGHLNKYSKIYGVWSLRNASRGYHYRVRVDYVRKSSDHSNINTNGSWFYFIVRK